MPSRDAWKTKAAIALQLCLVAKLGGAPGHFRLGDLTCPDQSVDATLRKLGTGSPHALAHAG